MKKILVVVGIAAAVVTTGGVVFLYAMSNYGPRFADVSHLLSPRIIEKAPAKMLVVEATGDPNTTVGPAFGLLFKTFYKIKDPSKGKLVAPRARWPKHFDTPRGQWLGVYALPVPPIVQTLPQVPSKEGLRAQLQNWQYGTVAEILHVGPYGSEDTTVVKLKRFIAGQGYEIFGDHEEEYLRGPGFLFSSPEKYLTVIRYEVKKKQ